MFQWGCRWTGISRFGGGLCLTTTHTTLASLDCTSLSSYHPPIPPPFTQTKQIGAYMQEEEMQKLAPHQQEQLAKLKDEAIKAARAAEGDGGEGGGQGGWGGRDPFPSKLG